MRRAILCFLLLIPFSATARQLTSRSPEPAPTQNAASSESAKEETPEAASVQDKPKGRLRIGVALEGGGALGLAHVGVLEWFEQPYSGGLRRGNQHGRADRRILRNGNESGGTEKTDRGCDWNEILSDATLFEVFPIEEGRSTSVPELLRSGAAQGLSIPSGLNSGHQIGLLIDRITLPYFRSEPFEELPAPFRCVATICWRTASKSYSNRARSSRPCARRCRFPARSSPSLTRTECWWTAVW